MKDRFLDVNVFESLVRPQYSYSCNISSITSCYKYLFNSDIRHEEVTEILGLDIGSAHNPGNRTLRSWIEKLVEHFSEKASIQILFEKGWKLDSKHNTKYWNNLKDLLMDENSFCIMHIEGHYAPILGFASYPKSPELADGDHNRWLFIADPSPNHSEARNPRQHWKLSPPIWSVRWGQIREEFLENSNYGIIAVTKEV